jgi:hypothetical protein
MARWIALPIFLTAFAAADAAEHKIVGVSMFKNGYAVVTRATDLSGNAVTEIDPHAGVLGSLWFGTGGDAVLSEAVLQAVETPSETELTTLDALLTANVGKTLTIETMPGRAGQEGVLTGKVLAAAGSIAILQTDQRIVAVAKANILRISSDQGLEYKAKGSSTRRVLRVTTRGTGKLYTIALQQGMSWSPAYQVDISDEKTAVFRCRAVVMNELADYAGVDVKLITGFPNIRFLNWADPFTAADALITFGATAGLSRAGGAGDALTNQAAGRVRGESVDFGNFDATGSGQQFENLFFYTLPKVTLKRGERLYRPLFQHTADYRHLYTIDLPDLSGEYTSNVRQGRPSTPPETIHVLEFRNTSGQPLTTAPALVLKNGEVIGQDQIDYTPAGDTVELQVGKALDIQSEEQSEQLQRERGAVVGRDGNHRFDRLTVKSTVTVVNRTSRSIDLRMRKATYGEIVSADNGGQSRTVPAGVSEPNPGLRIEWNLKLQPGERRVVTYAYSLLVPAIG